MRLLFQAKNVRIDLSESADGETMMAVNIPDQAITAWMQKTDYIELYGTLESELSGCVGIFCDEYEPKLSVTLYDGIGVELRSVELDEHAFEDVFDELEEHRRPIFYTLEKAQEYGRLVYGADSDFAIQGKPGRYHVKKGLR